MRQPRGMIADTRRTTFYSGAKDWHFGVDDDDPSRIELCLMDPEEPDRAGFRTVLGVLKLTEQQALDMLTELTRAILDPARVGLVRR